MEEFEVTATVKNLSAVTDFVTSHLDDAVCPFAARMQIELAVDEIFTNICMYAYAPDTGTAKVCVDTDTPGIFKLIFIDRGIPYNPLEKEDPDTTLSADQRKIGGLGIYLVKKSMDEMFYERKDGQNILTLVKRL